MGNIMIRTIDYGSVPVAKSTEFIHDDVIDTVETCDGNSYAIKTSFTGAVVAVKL